MRLRVLVLAAGRGERMRQGFPGIPKALVPVDHTPMIIRLIQTLLHSNHLDIANLTVVVRPEDEALFLTEFTRYLSPILLRKIGFVIQNLEDGYGTAAGVQAFLRQTPLPLSEDLILILNGDAPLLRVQSLENMIQHFTSDLLLGTVFVDNPHGYGRIVHESPFQIRILEQKEVDQLPPHHSSRNLHEVNTGIYLMAASLLPIVSSISTCPVTHEKKLTDLCLLSPRTHVFSGFSEQEVVNINSPLDRNYAEHLLFLQRQEAIHRPLFSLLKKDMRNR